MFFFYLQKLNRKYKVDEKTVHYLLWESTLISWACVHVFHCSMLPSRAHRNLMLPLLLPNNLWWDHFRYSGTLPNFPISNDYCSDICLIVLKSKCVGGICCLTTKLMKTGNWTTSVAWTLNKNTGLFICVFAKHTESNFHKILTQRKLMGKSC